MREPRPAVAKPPQRTSEPLTPLHQPLVHESGLLHTTGEARYVDDLPALPGTLVAQVVCSPHAHATITRLDVTRAKAVPGVAAVFTAASVPGELLIGASVHDEELFAAKTAHYLGHAIALVVGDTYDACRDGVRAVEVEYQPLPALTTVDAAIAAGSFLTADVHTMLRGDPKLALASAEVRVTGELRTGAQDHFYLETQCSLAVPDEGDAVRIVCSTQHPSEVQALVAHVLGWHRHQVVVEVPRMGGGFGGKETQAAPYACMAALAATKLRRPVKVWLNRDQDMMWTGKRHPFVTRYEAGFTKDGRLTVLQADLVSDGGWSLDLSRAILDRALFHADNAYFIPNVRLTGRIAKTNLPSNTAFRGFGGPQGMAVIEDVLDRVAERLQLDPADVRRKNLYGPTTGTLTPYWQDVKEPRIARIWDELLVTSSYAERRRALDAWNRAHPSAKRGLAVTPVKFGISFTTSFLNQAGAYVVLYSDGSAQLNHGGTEMGQGLHTKMLAICAHELGIPAERIRVMVTATDKVPNTSATAASSGADLNGQAVKQACEVLRERLRAVAARLLGVPSGSAKDILFAGGKVFLASRPELALPFEKVTGEAYLAQVPMSAAGFYKTPDIHYDRAAGRGKPFHYFAYGAAVSEVEVSGYTGEHRVRRVDILHDAGSSLVPTIDRGQVEGGFVQGVGWLTCEEVLFDEKGALRTHSPDTYKVPAIGDVPEDFRVALLENAAQDDVIHGSKAVGEPPLMLALSVVAALRHAIGAFGPPGREVSLTLPATPEAVLRAIELARAP